MSRPLYSVMTDCRSCYKCIRACPTKSISFTDNQAHIIPDECVLCGRCYYTCPQNCKHIRDDKPSLKALLAKGNCYASIAPSFMTSYPGSSFETLKAALLQLGFAGAEETAIGATIVKTAYEELVASRTQDIIISTCCHSANLLIQKHYPDLAKYLAKVLSPMQAHALDIKKRHPGCSVVFFGPCIAKKGESDSSAEYADLALTYNELDDLLEEAHIQVALDDDIKHTEESKARLFPTEGGILATMKKDPEYEYFAVSGMENIIGVLENLKKGGNIHKVFIEASACEGSCINGPALRKQNTVEALLNIRRSSGKKDFRVASYSQEELKKPMQGFAKAEAKFSEEEIAEVMKKMGKEGGKNELNCASCGYHTCRDKAIAVLQGKANVSMCLPYLAERVTSFSNDIINNSPNAIIVTDEALNITLANETFSEIVKKSSGEIIGSNLAEFLDPTPFLDVLDGAHPMVKRYYWERYDTYVEGTIRFDPRFHILVGTFRNRTAHELEKQDHDAAVVRAAEVAREVIAKNMRAVQEIAGLLGESAADTKIALTNLQKVLKPEAEGKHGK